MKILVISDCHSNLDALNAVWEKENNSDLIFFVGDMVDWGFYPHQTVQWFIQHKAILKAVLGNHDEYILKEYDKGEFAKTNEPKDFAELTLNTLTPEDIDFLRLIPHEISFIVGNTTYYMCHTPDEVANDDIFYVERQFLDLKLRPFFHERWEAKVRDCKTEKKCIIYGHTHLPSAIPADTNALVLNPGSLSYRFGEQWQIRCADYMVIEDGAISFRHADFNTAHLMKAIEGSNFITSVKDTAASFYKQL